ncbi:MAG: hypothetical protein ACOYJ6_01955 [Caulobacterales bacterium]
MARKLQSDVIVLKPIVPRTTLKAPERDDEDEPIAAAEEGRFARSVYQRLRRDRS